MMQRYTFDLQDFSEQIDFQSIRTYIYAISNEKIAIATRNNVIISSGKKDKYYYFDDNNNNNEFNIRILLEPQENFGRPSALKWITEDVICVGFESGDICCYGDNGYAILEQKFNDSSVQSIKVCHSELPGMGPGLWILYESGFLISIPMKQLLQGQYDGLVKFKLVEETPVHDFVFLPFIYNSSIFDVPDKRVSHSVLICGMNAALSIYNIGGPPQFQHIGKLAGYVKERVSSVISKTITSLFSFSNSSKTESIIDTDHITITSSLDFEDSKRRILRLSMEPSCGKLVAAADSLGRVTLYDTRMNCIIRIWKGVRDARLAWTLVNQSKYEYQDDNEFLERLGKTNSELLPYLNSIALAIYAPQVGLVSLYAMRHGPCLRCIPVGLQCHIFTAIETSPSGKFFPQCYLLKGESTNLVCSVIDPLGKDDTDIDRKNIDGELSPVKEIINHDDKTDDNWEITDNFIESDAMESFKRVIDIWLKRLKSKKYSSNSPTPVMAIDMVEEKLLGILKVINNPEILLRCIAILDVLECNTQESNCIILNKTDDDLDFLLSAGPISFSSKFLSSTFRLMIDIGLKSDNKDLEIDGENRLDLLLVYDTLKDLQTATNVPTYGNAKDELTDEVIMSCRQQNCRAEAFCWTVRELKQKILLSNNEGDTYMTKKRTFSGNSTPVDGDYLSIGERRTRLSSGSGVSPINFSTPGGLGSPPLQSPTNSSQKSFTVFRNSWNRFDEGMQSRLSDVDSPVPDARSSIQSTASPFGDDENVICTFGMFRGFFKISNDSLIPTSFSLRLNELLTILENRSDAKISSSNDHFKIKINDAISWSPQAIIADNFCNLMLSPLLGDAFGLHEYTECLKQIGLFGGLSLSNILLLMFGFFEKQPLQSMIPTLLNKQLSSSPFQRWLRDTLLSFQDEFSNLANIGYDGVENMDESDDDAKTEKMEIKNLVQLVKKVALSIQLHDDVIPTYDDVVKYCLRSAWQFARQSFNLESMMNLALLVFETINAVGEQVERRTYGQCTLKSTIVSWKNLINQLRICLILTSCSSDVKRINIDSLSSGSVSIYRFLAYDTLSFTLKNDQSIEHESRCQEVFLKRSSAVSTSSTSTPTSTVVSTPLLAWGSTSDIRWRELFNESENVSKNEKSGSENKEHIIRKKRPLLLFFPYHNIPLVLGSYRCWTLVEKWCKSPSRLEFLSLAVTHAFSLPPILRAIVSEYVCNIMIFPFVRSFIDFEESNNNIINQGHLSISVKEFMNIMVDPKQIKEFIIPCINFLSYCDPIQVLQLNGPLECELVETNDNIIDNVDTDELEKKIWPSTTDISLTATSKSYVSAGGCSIFSIKAHLALLYAIQLRTQCGLRGIKVSEIFGNKTVEKICIKDSLIKKSTESINVNDGELELEKIRCEFILTCFRRLSVEEPMFVYKIGELWEIDMDKIRFIHITTLIERNICDDYAEEVMQQVKNIGVLVDNVTILLQKRLGAFLARIDRIQKYGGLIAGMDAEAFKFVRNSHNDNNNSNNNDDIEFNFISTRHLIIRIQGYLLSMELDNNTNILRNDKWTDRKHKIELLLHVITELQRYF